MLEERIGVGNFGEVWKGRCKYTLKPIAIKISRIDVVDTLVYESKVMKYLKGAEGVVPFLSCGKLSDERHYLVMEEQGASLSELVNKEGLSESKVKAIGRALLRILESIHNKGIIHRDVKPDNFLISKDGKKIVIADYGFCKFWCDDSGNPKPEAKYSTPVGTWNYMSVDVHSGRTACRKDDLESLCYTLIELLTGYLPWQMVEDKTPAKEVIRATKYGVSPIEIVNKAIWLSSMLDYVRKLGYYSRPDYRLLKELLQDKV
jgi:serine/threonine protein kinase